MNAASAWKKHSLRLGLFLTKHNLTSMTCWSLLYLSTNLSDFGLGLADLVEPDKLLVPSPPIVDWGGGCLSWPLTPLAPQLTCILEEGLYVKILRVSRRIHGGCVSMVYKVVENSSKRDELYLKGSQCALLYYLSTTLPIRRGGVSGWGGAGLMLSAVGSYQSDSAG